MAFVVFFSAYTCIYTYIQLVMWWCFLWFSPVITATVCCGPQKYISSTTNGPNARIWKHLFYSSVGEKKKLKIFSISLFLWLLVERDSVVTQRDPSGESRSHQSTWRWTVEFRGVLYESRKPFQDTAASTDVVNPHEAAACEGDVPLLGQVKHLLQINRVCDSLIP